MSLGYNCCCPQCCCDPAPANYLAVFSGITDGTSTGCNFANRSFCLCKFQCDLYQSPGSIAEAPVAGDCVHTFNTSHANLEFLCDAGIVRLTVYAACSATGFSRALAVYELSRASWNCAGSNVMSKVSNTADCGSWPSTITLTPNDTGLSCNCQCGHNIEGTADFRPYVFDLRFGPITSGGDCVNDCSCDIPYTRICMQDNGNCIWVGYWFPPGRLDLTNLYPFSGSEIPGQCSPAYFFTRATVIVAYDFSSDAIILTLGPNYFSSGVIRYSIAAASFNATGNNTLSFLDSTYTSCTMPATVDFNFYSRDNLDCQDDLFRCDVCNGGTMAIGWTFTLAGITGPEIDLGDIVGHSAGCKATPCLAFNGTYCLGNNGMTCDWSTTSYGGTGGGFTPDPVSYKRLDNSICGSYAFPTFNPFTAKVLEARMSIEGGLVVLQVVLTWLSAEPLQTESCGRSLVYAIGVDEFDCNGPNDLTLLCGHELLLAVPSDSQTGTVTQCDCTSVPSTITITPTTACGTPPVTTCLCLPAASYSPRVKISGIAGQSCADCPCFSELDLCFDTVDADCQWSKSFTLPTSGAVSCETAARKAVLLIGSTNVTVTIYDISNNILAVFTGATSGFTCDDSAFSLSFTTDNDSLCDWSGATCTLDMHGAACSECACPTAAWLTTVQYGAEQYTLCIDVGTCSGTSINVGTHGIFIQDGSGNKLDYTVEFGTLPTKFARILVYYQVPSVSSTLIGVYNFLLDFDANFLCTSTNSLTLATGNAGQCGEAVDVAGKTSNLASTAFLVYKASACITCDGIPVPYVALATFKDHTGNCCDDGKTCYLVFDSGLSAWTGTITGCGSGESIDIALTQTGTACTDFRLDVVYVNSCDAGVTNKAPYSCTCDLIKFKVTAAIGVEDEIWIQF